MTKTSLTAGAVQAILGVLVLLGVVELTEDQLAGIMAAVNACLVAALSWFSPDIPLYGRGSK